MRNILGILCIVFFHCLCDIYCQQIRSNQYAERIDCFPEAESKFSSYSKERCLARGCLFDDASPSGVIQCYMRPNYGYIMKEPAQVTSRGLKFRLGRNQAVGSMFSSPIENVALDVHYYTNDILRFRLYDADNERYEVSYYNTRN